MASIRQKSDLHLHRKKKKMPKLPGKLDRDIRYKKKFSKKIAPEIRNLIIDFKEGSIRKADIKKAEKEEKKRIKKLKQLVKKKTKAPRHSRGNKFSFDF